MCRARGLPDHLPLAALPVDELHQVEAARAADGFADLPGLESEDGVGEHRREIGGEPPAEVAAFERLLPVGVGDRHVREVRSGAELLEHALRPPTRLVDLLRRCAVGNRDQDVSDTVPVPVRLCIPRLSIIEM